VPAVRRCQLVTPLSRRCSRLTLARAAYHSGGPRLGRSTVAVGERGLSAHKLGGSVLLLVIACAGSRRAPKNRKASFDPKRFLAKVGNGKTVAKYHKNQIVFSQGDVADAVFYLQEGKLKVTVISEQGKEAVVAILGVGDFFGEGCLNGHALRVATSSAMEECVVTRIEKASMIAALHNEPEFSAVFIAYLLARNGRIEEDLVDQLFNSSERRLARVLLLLANFGKEGRPEPIVGKITQEMLAEMIGTTRARVSFFMNKFRKLGFIEYNGKLEVHTSLLNMVLHDNPHIAKTGGATPVDPS
jgi:CRP/FNR family transcriptional regulator, cyclic AMP receptor protein